MAQRLPILIPKEAIASFCQRHHIRKLSLFGSILRDDFSSSSDVDFLVEFEPEHILGYFHLIGIEIELSEMINRKADLRTPKELSLYFRQQVLQEAIVQYE
ncbi:nucleotidyltransferase family protein [Pseudanabaena sp. Chao 1811]|uniref:nucleotidyltransferase family protein n=1 Tax=Pseudanabaena sp. Chao 1811 TaxID=2963092 RepID=UPI0022F38319|nr:nucleotidyltransferase domain-containing protein [Pseudanabaena sp. Chao 1811]